MTPDKLNWCVEFRGIDDISRLLLEMAQPTIHLVNTDQDPALQLDEVVTIEKRRRKTTPTPRRVLFVAPLIV